MDLFLTLLTVVYFLSFQLDREECIPSRNKQAESEKFLKRDKDEASYFRMEKGNLRYSLC
ncbi:hypothetical protein CAEBREN_12225 [Caenorhabditis brenneri]|uniref:Uncharacterized protein n=1 Tax=Caenorhabditis brenneri TaxID=135651 RepID=G0N4J9_CAEBE|nr:hypothetical protein CAEBREN_12225 [Caenorhabditis brenneri]